MKKQGFIYILSNKNRTTLYIGVTNDLKRRILEHKAGKAKFSSKFNLFDLLYFEQINGIEKAIERENQLKNWNSEWKWELIKKENPELVDLAKGWFSEEEMLDYKLKKED
jgi:putative endonuclease